ncbi:hypothetical protein SAMN04489712_10619 [Thermomonospora echinospora]|uniref:Uncharacterized protein n=1 Tax=Thermomonospora echinospora TaxID=1992 RepID=A0A1H6AUT6_9ACTN|nr:hypothetical protein [Thermomonospora echinospora]SEG52281.1 hypothetical protein SAMN04489712_10619 [Thermomonospora echinospora]
MSTDAVPDDDRSARLLLRTAARELAEIATTLRSASVHATAAATDGAVGGALPRAPAAGLRAQRAVLRAVTNRRGLGYAVAGGTAGALGAKLGGMVGAHSLAVRVMTTSLRLRIAAVTLQNPELAADPLLRRLSEAVAADREIESVRALCALVRDRGTARALSAIAPVFGEVLALRALLDQNPLNDRTAWLIASGSSVASADPITGLSNRAIAVLDVGEGAARRVAPRPDEAARLRSRGSLLDFLANLCAVGPTGRALVQSVMGPDGIERHVVQVPGMRIGDPDHESPGDLLGAFSSTLLDSAPFSRALAKAIDDFGVPAGAEIAMVGHSAGGAAIMNLAQDAMFCARYTLTHVVAIGSPVDFKRPASPHTWVASITNQHDLVPSLDGQGAGNCFDLHPDWYVVDYTDPTHLFPACHSLEHYTANLAEDLPEAREHIERELRPYQGPVTRSQLYQLYDREAPARRTIETRRVTTAGGPVELPIRCYEGLALTAYFTVDAQAAARLLGDRGRAVRMGGRALAAIHAFDNRRSSLGEHREVHLGIVVDDPGGRQPLRTWRELLARADRRALGTHFVASAFTDDLVCAAASEVWGHAAFVGDLRVECDAGRLHVEVGAPRDPAMALSGPLGPGLPITARDLVVYSHRGGIPLRSHIEERGGRRAHPSPGARLTVGTADHPVARHLRDLGLDGARPMLCLVSPARRSRRDAGVPWPAR